MKQILSAFCLAACGAACAVGLPPVVSDVSYVQSSNNKTVAISYELANGPAIVTLDLTTNRTSIGSAYVQNTLSGAVNRVVSNGRHTIWWHPLLELAPGESMTIKCKAPDYSGAFEVFAEGLSDDGAPLSQACLISSM